MRKPTFQRLVQLLIRTITNLQIAIFILFLIAFISWQFLKYQT